MKHPPLLPILFVVMILGIVHTHMQAKGWLDTPLHDLAMATVVLFGTGFVLKPLALRGQSPKDISSGDDDLDRSA